MLLCFGLSFSCWKLSLTLWWSWLSIFKNEALRDRFEGICTSCVCWPVGFSIEKLVKDCWSFLSISVDLPSWATLSSGKNTSIFLGVIILVVTILGVMSEEGGRRLGLSLLSIKILTSSLFFVAHLIFTFLWIKCPSSRAALNRFNLFPAVSGSPQWRWGWQMSDHSLQGHSKGLL